MPGVPVLRHVSIQHIKKHAKQVHDDYLVTEEELDKYVEVVKKFHEKKIELTAEKMLLNKKLTEEATRVEDASERRKHLARTQEVHKMLVPTAAKLISQRKKEEEFKEQKQREELRRTPSPKKTYACDIKTGLCTNVPFAGRKTPGSLSIFCANIRT